MLLLFFVFIYCSQSALFYFFADSFRSQESMEYDFSEDFNPAAADGVFLNPTRAEELRQELGRFNGRQKNNLLPIRGIQSPGATHRNKGVTYSKHQPAYEGPRLYKQPKLNKEPIMTYPGEGRYDTQTYNQINPFQFDKSGNNNLVIEVSDEADKVPYVIGTEDYPSLAGSIQYLNNGISDVTQWNSKSRNAVFYDASKNSLEIAHDQRDCQHIFSWLRRIISKKGTSKKLGKLHQGKNKILVTSQCIKYIFLYTVPSETLLSNYIVLLGQMYYLPLFSLQKLIFTYI